MHYFGTSLKDDYLGHSPTLEFSRLESLYLLKLNIFFLVVPKIFQRLMDGCKVWIAFGCCKLELLLNRLSIFLLLFLRNGHL